MLHPLCQQPAQHTQHITATKFCCNVRFQSVCCYTPAQPVRHRQYTHQEMNAGRQACTRMSATDTNYSGIYVARAHVPTRMYLQICSKRTCTCTHTIIPMLRRSTGSTPSAHTTSRYNLCKQHTRRPLPAPFKHTHLTDNHSLHVPSTASQRHCHMPYGQA